MTTRTTILSHNITINAIDCISRRMVEYHIFYKDQCMIVCIYMHECMLYLTWHWLWFVVAFNSVCQYHPTKCTELQERGANEDSGDVDNKIWPWYIMSGERKPVVLDVVPSFLVFCIVHRIVSITRQCSPII